MLVYFSTNSSIGEEYDPSGMGEVLTLFERLLYIKNMCIIFSTLKRVK